MNTEQVTHQDEDQFTIHAVGSPYGGVAKPTDPGPMYNFRHGYHTLTIFQSQLDQETLDAYRDATARIGFWKDPPIMWAIFHFEGLGWQDAPYTPHKVEPEGRILIELPNPESRYPITIIVANAEDSMVRAIRSTTISPRVSRDARDITKELMESPFTESEFDRKINETYFHHQSSEEMKDLPRYLDPMGT